jgi:DNA-binding CsgD family transcriptional regulator
LTASDSISSFQKQLGNIDNLSRYNELIINTFSIGDSCCFVWDVERKEVSHYQSFSYKPFLNTEETNFILNSEKRASTVEIVGEFINTKELHHEFPFLKFTYTINSLKLENKSSLVVQEIPFGVDLLHSLVIITNTSHLKLLDKNVSLTNVYTGKFYPKINLLGKRKKGLSDTELTVIKLVIKGQNNKEIANYCNRSEETIKASRKKIIKKLGAKNMFEAITHFKSTNNE